MSSNPNPQPAPLDLDAFTGHTPGLWDAFPNYSSHKIEVGHLEAHSNLVRLVVELPLDDLADARLIAAAPALLAECRKLRSLLAEASQLMHDTREAACALEQDSDLTGIVFGDIYSRQLEAARAALSERSE